MEDIQHYIDIIKEDEGFISVAKKPTKKANDPVTIGAGHTRGLDGKPIKKGTFLEEGSADANKLLMRDINERLPRFKKVFPNLNSYPKSLQAALFSGFYRGDFDPQAKKAYAKNTVKLLNEGKVAEASKEFLNSREYEASKKKGSGFGGVAKRMKRISNAMLTLVDPGPTLSKREEPKEIEVEVSEAKPPKSFKQAFAEARANKDAEFTYGGDRYNTRLKGETPQQYAAFLGKDRPVQVARKGGMVIKNYKERT
tara:strand:- start:49 stop:810 length:762 start_codon:yes stop_codon:yes gene_type:complete